ncbi:MAG: hypothetical protein AB1331_00175 [Bacillota bacterium]
MDSRTYRTTIVILGALILISAILTIGAWRQNRQLRANLGNALGEAVGSIKSYLNEAELILSRAVADADPENLLVAVGDLQAAGRLIRVVANLDRSHHQQWLELNSILSVSVVRALDGLRAELKQTGVLTGENRTRLGQVIAYLPTARAAFPDEVVTGTRPRLVFDSRQIVRAVSAGRELQGELAKENK